MIDLRRAGVPAAFIISTALIVAACGGGATASSPAGATTEPGATAAESAAPSEAPAATESAEASMGAIPTFDLEALTGGLPGVDSYRTETSVGGVKQYESVVVTKPVLSRAITVYDDQGEVSQRLVAIGDELWIADGADGAFTADTTGMGSALLMGFDPALMLGGFANLDWAGAAANLGTEDKNGIQAHHLKIDSTTFVGAAAAFPAGAALDVWVAEAGYLVAWEMSGFPDDANFTIEVSGVNDPSNKVERPS